MLMAKSNKIIDVDEIKKRLDAAIQVVGEEIGRDIQIAYDRAIESFYNDYSPVWYDRTYSTYLASSYVGGGKPYYKKTGNMSCEAGITVDSSFMGEPYNVGNHGWAKNGKATASFIFDRTFNKGIHGFTSGDKNKKNKTLSEYRWVPGNNAFSGYNFGGYIDMQYAEELGIMGRSSFVRNGQRAGKQTVPTKSSPPKVKMNKEFRNIKKSIDSRIDAAFKL